MPILNEQGESFSELAIEVFRLNRLLLEAGDQLTAPVELTSARWQVLGVVEHGPIPVAHVARLMGLTRQSVQQSADALEADGLISYSANPHHRRAKLMALTPKGREVLDYVQQRHAEWANQVSQNLALDDLRAAVALLQRARASLEHGQGNDEGAEDDSRQ
jgi:DNA-binding MarR family transcriptional regulator